MVKKTVNWSIESMPKREDFILCLKRRNGDGVGGGSGFSIEILAEEVNVPHHVNLRARGMPLWHSDGYLVSLLCFTC